MEHEQQVFCEESLCSLSVKKLQVLFVRLELHFTHLSFVFRNSFMLIHEFMKERFS
jgi:hypothetical protein